MCDLTCDCHRQILGLPRVRPILQSKECSAFFQPRKLLAHLLARMDSGGGATPTNSPHPNPLPEGEGLRFNLETLLWARTD